MGKRIAVVTGASSGLGQEFVRQLEGACKDEGALFERCPEELWVIARREDRLQALAELTQIQLRVLPMDLTQKACIDTLAELLEHEEPDVLMLINAAGFGRIGRTMDQTLDELDGMIDLNCRAAVDMTQLVLPYMKKNARILEICSTAAFQPITRLNVYAATKAFLYHYSRALRVELLPRRIYVTAVCPYWVKDTEFIALADQKNDGKDPEIANYFLASRKEDVVRHALTDAALRMPVSTPGPVSTLHRFIRKLFPIDVLLLVWEAARRASSPE